MGNAYWRECECLYASGAGSSAGIEVDGDEDCIRVAVCDGDTLLE